MAGDARQVEMKYRQCACGCWLSVETGYEEVTGLLHVRCIITKVTQGTAQRSRSSNDDHSVARPPRLPRGEFVNDMKVVLGMICTEAAEMVVREAAVRAPAQATAFRDALQRARTGAP